MRRETRFRSIMPRLFALASTIAVAAGTCHAATSADSAAPGRLQLTRPVDVVFCLDTSGSMEDLLDAARARIWDVLNELGRLMPTPQLHVGVLSYGTEKGSPRDGYIVKVTDLSGDLDSVYAELMALTTAGSEEFVGRVLNDALRNMNWSRDPDALKIIFIAGNESADQGVEDHDFRLVARTAREQGIFINALFAGNRDQAIVERWPDIARSGAGTFSAIDPETSTIQIATPQDRELLELNGRLNATYVPYGPEGEAGLANQVAQDGNASRLGVDSCSSRIVAKGSALYSNAAWDLVDAVAQDELRLSSVPEHDLPQSMRSMTTEGRVAFLNVKRSEREAIQHRIQQLSTEREAFVQVALARERKARPGLGEAMRDALRDQAVTKGFTCEGC